MAQSFLPHLLLPVGQNTRYLFIHLLQRFADLLLGIDTNVVQCFHVFFEDWFYLLVLFRREAKLAMQLAHHSAACELGCPWRFLRCENQHGRAADYDAGYEDDKAEKYHSPTVGFINVADGRIVGCLVLAHCATHAIACEISYKGPVEAL